MMGLSSGALALFPYCDSVQPGHMLGKEEHVLLLLNFALLIAWMMGAHRLKQTETVLCHWPFHLPVQSVRGALVSLPNALSDRDPATGAGFRPEATWPKTSTKDFTSKDSRLPLRAPTLSYYHTNI